MFKSMTLRNFQCHKRLDIKFGKRVTTVVGPSDVGKSAVIRAIKWLATNKPPGATFRKTGTKNTIVGLKFDGHKLIRKKSKSTNEMVLDGKKFKAFGSTVPDEVANTLNLGTVNFQDQHDPPFWFSSTPGQVSRELNSIVNLDTIDRIMTILGHKMRIAKTNRSVLKKHLENTEEECKRLEFVDDLEEDCEDLLMQQRKLEKKETRTKRFFPLFNQAYYYQDRLQKLTRARSEALKARKAAKQWVKKKAVYERVTALLGDAGEAERVEGLKEVVKEGTAVLEIGTDTLRKRGVTTKLRGLTDQGIVLKKRANRTVPRKEDLMEMKQLLTIRKKVTVKEIRLISLLKEAVQLDKTWAVVFQKMWNKKQEMKQKIDGICPLCGGEFDE